MPIKTKKITKKELAKIKKREDNKLWKKVRHECILRDEGCVICGSTERMSAHHLIPREIKEMKFDVDNLITLCPSHHKFSLEISAHRNPLAFSDWLLVNRTYQYGIVMDKFNSLKVVTNKVYKNLNTVNDLIPYGQESGKND